MSVDHIRYDLLVREALRGVVRRVVSDVAKNGLPGDHHFYISFDTRAPGVRLSPRMRGQYPEEMTIVLQHQFWDLAVTDDAIEVGLSFGGVPERLVVPLDALKGFFDPSVQFGLEFEPVTERSQGGDAEQEPAASTASGLPSALKGAVPAQRKAKPADIAKAADGKPQIVPSEQPAEPIKQDGGAEVVRLDRFRKK